MRNALRSGNLRVQWPLFILPAAFSSLTQIPGSPPASRKFTRSLSSTQRAGSNRHPVPILSPPLPSNGSGGVESTFRRSPPVRRPQSPPFPGVPELGFSRRILRRARRSEGGLPRGRSWRGGVHRGALDGREGDVQADAGERGRGARNRTAGRPHRAAARRRRVQSAGIPYIRRGTIARYKCTNAHRADMKISLLKDQVKIQEGQMKIQAEMLELQRLRHDTERMAPWVRDYYIKMQQEISLKRTGGNV